ncbi:hypothetical protein [Methylobacterium sp. SD21]|uniref:hypothetical protein n=1 Tax=Methylobacterium litchii TaxID=3138810 RepID=UPI00313C2069
MALPKVSPGLLPAENYRRFNGAFDVVDGLFSGLLSTSTRLSRLEQTTGSRLGYVETTARSLQSSVSTLALNTDTALAKANDVVAVNRANGQRLSVLEARLLETRLQDGYVQMRFAGLTAGWQNLVRLADITGQPGASVAGPEGAAADVAASATRPGDGPSGFTNSLSGGDPRSLPPLVPDVVLTANGRAQAARDGGVVASRRYTAIEPGHVYRLRFVVSRAKNPTDPMGDAVRLAIRWFDAARSPMEGADTIVVDLPNLVYASGRVERTLYVARATGPAVDLLTADGAKFARPYVKAFGTDQITAVEVIEMEDVTDTVTSLVEKLTDPASVPAVSARLDKLEAREWIAQGLASGGGDLKSDRTFTVQSASDDEAQDGVRADVVMTPATTRQAINALTALAQIAIPALNDTKAVADWLFSIKGRTDRPGPHVFDYIQGSYHDAIEAGTSTQDVTEGLRAFAASLGSGGRAYFGSGQDANLAKGVYNISDTVSFNQVATRVRSAAMGAANIVLRRDLGQGVPAIELRQKAVGYSNVGSGVEGLRVDMLGHTGVALKCWKPYDCFDIINAFFENVAPGDHAVEIVPDPIFGPTDIYSQGVNMRNVLSAHSDPNGAAPLYYMESLNEGDFSLVKAFGCFPGNFGGNKAAPCHGFHLKDCNGLTFTNPSAAFCFEHAFRIEATGGSICRGITIETPTIEGGRGVLRTIGVAGNDDVNRVLDLTVRNPRKVFPSTQHPDGDFALSRTRYGRFEVKNYTVVCSETYRNRFETDSGSFAITGADPSDRIECLPDVFPRTKIEALLGGPQAVDKGQWTGVLFNVEAGDPSGEYDPTIQVWTVAQYGRFRVEVGLQILPGSADPGQIGVRLTRNGVPFRDLFLEPYSSTFGIKRTHAAEVDLVPFDQIAVQVYADMGATLTQSDTASYLRVTPFNNGYAL